MTGRLRRQPLKISLPNRNRNIIKAAQPQNPTVAYNGPTPRGGLDYSRPRRDNRRTRRIVLVRPGTTRLMTTKIQ